METDLILRIVFGLISAAFALFGIIANIKGGKWKKAYNIIKAGTPALKTLGDLIQKAEKFTHFSGVEKLEWVLTQYKIECLSNGEKFDEAKVTEDVEYLIGLSKNVNKKEVKVIE